MTKPLAATRTLLAGALLAFALVAHAGDAAPPSSGVAGGGSAIPAPPDRMPQRVQPDSPLVNGQLSFRGAWTYLISPSAGTVRLRFDELDNLSSVYFSGTIRIRYVATVDPMPPIGGPAYSYYTMGAFTLGQLDPQHYWGPVDYTVPFTPPPDGVYYVSLVAYEYEPDTCANADLYCRDDFVPATRRILFSNGYPYDGGPANTTATGIAVEYYWAARDHYFFTANIAEIAALDALNGGWQRTGNIFGVYATPVAGSIPVCRFYIPPAYGDSHVYTFGADLCAASAVKFPVFTYESPEVADVLPSDPFTGACPAGSTPLYKLWNQRPDTNHRYTIQPAVRDQMLAKGYVLEGNGNPAVAACAPL